MYSSTISSDNSPIKLMFIMNPQQAAKDKSALQAQLASSHKENLDLTRAKKILQAKVSCVLL